MRRNLCLMCRKKLLPITPDVSGCCFQHPPNIELNVDRLTFSVMLNKLRLPPSWMKTLWVQPIPLAVVPALMVPPPGEAPGAQGGTNDAGSSAGKMTSEAVETPEASNLYSTPDRPHPKMPGTVQTAPILADFFTYIASDSSDSRHQAGAPALEPPLLRFRDCPRFREPQE